MQPALIGCSGWNSDDWRGCLYPAGEPRRRWLELYAQRFDTVEVNNTLYRLPQRQAVARWVAQTPPGFVFAVKASRYITHVRRLVDLDGIRRFYEPLAPLIEAGRLGPVLWQLPVGFQRDDERLRRWLQALPAGLHTIEFRHPSWFTARVVEALRERGVALTIGDHPERPFQTHVATAGWRYLRFHYGSRSRDGNYSATELEAGVRRISQWRRRGPVYAYFNNDWRGFAPANAALLARRLRSQPAVSRLRRPASR